MIFNQLFDNKSSTYTYIISSGKGREALIIDPVIENTNQYLEILKKLNLKLVKVIDTHIHADHISGLNELNKRTNCARIMRQSDKLDHIGVFGKTVEDVALFTKSLIKKDLYDTSTVHYAADEMLKVCKKGPLYEPKFIFYKTKNWKNIDKESQKSFDFFIKTFQKNIEVFDTPSYFDDIPKYHKIIHETDMANNFQGYYEKSKKKLSKEMISAIERGLKYSAKDYAEAIDFMKRSYESYKEVFEDYHGVISPSSAGVAPKGLKSTGSPEFCTIWTYMGLPTISLPLLTGANNLPLGVQLIGDKLDDLRFLGVANWLEKKCKKYAK